MTIFLSHLFMIVVFLSIGEPVFTDDEVPRENPLPKRDASVPKIEDMRIGNLPTPSRRYRVMIV